MEREFDELNSIQYKRSIPFQEYFGEMELSDKEKEKRIKAAEEIESMMFFIFSLIYIMSESGTVDKNHIESEITKRYTEILQENMTIDKYFKDYVRQFSNTFIDTTFEEIDDPWYLSSDRARFVAENESNNVFSHEEYIKAINSGKTRKKWITMKDRRVRHSHRELDEKLIKIGEQFVVGNSLMNFPRDLEFAPSPDQVISCRCSIKYF